MDEYEYRRMKPMLWAMFAAAIAQKNSTTLAASKADDLLAEFEQRFPAEKRED